MPRSAGKLRTVARTRRMLALAALCAGILTPFPLSAQPHPEMIIQYFSTSWVEISRRIPEIAAAGYTAIWLPPPTKGAEGVADVGFSVFDRFDLGDRDQRGTVPTKYGTKDDVVKLVREAHRFGIKVYFDTVMNHNANPAKIENPGVALQPVPIDGFPGTHPLDYHVLPARDAGGGVWTVRNPALFGGTTYDLRPNTRENEPFVPVVPMPVGTSIPGFTHLARAPWIDFSTAGRNEEMHLSLLGLIDFALEQQVTGGAPGPRDGINLVSEQPLPRYIRMPNRADTYPNNTPVAEDVREYMIRWIRWFGDTTDCDGLRLDAIKHVPPTFFAYDFSGDPIAFNLAFQHGYHRRRGIPDSNQEDLARDGLLFGESFTGDLDSLQEYRRTGMHLLDFPLLFTMAHTGGVFARNGDGDIGQLSFPQGGMDGAFHEFGGLGRTAGVAFVQSHDTDPPGAQPNPAYAYIMTRVGHAVVFYDGNNYNPNTFVHPGRLDALGELGSPTITTMLSIRSRFARGGMFNRFVDGDVYVYERVVQTPDGTGGATLLVAITDSTSQEARLGEFDPRPLIVTEFLPGTVLQELTGNGAVRELTVIDPAAVPQAARSRAQAEFARSSAFPLPRRYGLVYLQIPAGPTRGYVAYAPKTPPLAVTLAGSNGALLDRTITTAGPRRTPAGAPIAASVIEAKALGSGTRLTINAVSDPTAAKVYARIDQAAIPGLTRVSGSPDGLYDGFYELGADGPGRFKLADADLGALSEGVHLVTVRAASPGTPSFYAEAHAFIVIERRMTDDAGVAVPPDAGDAGTTTSPDAGTVVPRDDGGAPLEREADGGTASPSELDPEVKLALDTIVTLILEERYSADFDLNQDGVIDARDFVLRAKQGRAP